MTRLSLSVMFVAAALALPATAFAQDNPGLTRAQVRAQLIEVEQAGYNPSSHDVYYPADIQAAEARVAAANGRTEPSYGPSTEGTSDSGLHAAASANIVTTRSLYSGH